MLVDAPKGGFDLSEITEEADAILQWVPNWSHIKGVEVGSLRGKTAAVLLHRLPGLHLTMVDPFHTEGIVKDTPEEVQEALVNNVRPYAERQRLIKLRSLDAATLFANETCCFVHIDALHDYDSVVADINAWWTKVRKGGILCGHDYGRTKPRITQPGTAEWGVKRAVDEWADGAGLTVHTYRWSWAVKKEA